MKDKLLAILCTSCGHPISSHEAGADWPCQEISTWTKEKCKCTRCIVKGDDVRCAIY